MRYITIDFQAIRFKAATGQVNCFWDDAIGFGCLKLGQTGYRKGFTLYSLVRFWESVRTGIKLLITGKMR